MIPFLPLINDRLPETRAGRRNAFGKFLFTGSPVDVPEGGVHAHPWYLVLWLTGVDYFSTLGYAPGIALIAAGALCLPATGVLVLVTILGAVPIYAEVAARSYAGQGSIALLENLFSGWKSKIAKECLRTRMLALAIVAFEPSVMRPRPTLLLENGY